MYNIIFRRAKFSSIMKNSSLFSDKVLPDKVLVLPESISNVGLRDMQRDVTVEKLTSQASQEP